MAHLYKQYIKLLNKWPVNKNRENDLGEHIRKQIKIAFAKGESSKIEDINKCQQDYESLDRIASNYYKNKYPVTLKTTSTNLTVEQCSLALSAEIQKYINEQKLSRFEKFKRKIENTITYCKKQKVNNT